MKKYLVLSFLFLLAVTPVWAKQGTSTTNSSSKTISVSPTGNQVKNQDEVQTKNQGEEKQLDVKTQENEQLNQNVDEAVNKVSDQVHELIETVGARGGIGQQVKEIAQNQVKLQQEIKDTIGNINSRSALAKFFMGSDKNMVKTMEYQMEQNRLMIQQLEELKLKFQNAGDLQQIQETIDLMLYQNTSLEEKIENESQIKGMFGWLINLLK